VPRITSPLLVALVLAGCGGSAGSTASTVAQQQQGLRSGEALVRIFATTRYPTGAAFSQDFQLWVEGRTPDTGGPSKPLPVGARRAAAAVVLSYATALEAAKGWWSPGQTAEIKNAAAGATPGLDAFLSGPGKRIQAQFLRTQSFETLMGRQVACLDIQGPQAGGTAPPGCP
jgi:hypothetical protein